MPARGVNLSHLLFLATVDEECQAEEQYGQDSNIDGERTRPSLKATRNTKNDDAYLVNDFTLNACFEQYESKSAEGLTNFRESVMQGSFPHAKGDEGTRHCYQSPETRHCYQSPETRHC